MGEGETRRYRVDMHVKDVDYAIVLDDYRTISAAFEDASKRLAGMPVCRQLI